jgi:hypothetical protein
MGLKEALPLTAIPMPKKKRLAVKKKSPAEKQPAL